MVRAQLFGLIDPFTQSKDASIRSKFFERLSKVQICYQQAAGEGADIDAGQSAPVRRWFGHGSFRIWFISASNFLHESLSASTCFTRRTISAS
jgi:hypothetical protein